MRVPCGNWRMWAVIAVTLAVCAPASAFYWYDWPGSRIPPVPSILPPDQGLPGNPPIPPRHTEPMAPPIKTDNPPPIKTQNPPPVGPPEQTPEPATGLIGLLALGAVAAAKRWKRK